MTKSDLRTGMVVTCHNGYKYTVYLDTCIGESVLTNGCGWVNLNEYDEELKNKLNENFNIVKVEELTNLFCLTVPTNEIIQYNLSTIWTCSKQMTVAEIEAILGYKVEIIAEK